MAETGITTLIETGKDFIIEWKIDHFLTLSISDASKYYSPDISFGGELWHLGIFPNGCDRKQSSGYLDVYLCKHYSRNIINQSYSISLKTVKGSVYNEENFVRVFDDDNYIHEFIKFIPRKEVTRRRSELIPDGTLTLVLTIKNSTCAGSASNSAFAECSDCKGTFISENMPSHKRKCLNRNIKCPYCLKTIALQKWFEEHECQQERPEDESGGSGYCVSPLEKKVLNDLKSLFNDKEGCDITFKVKGSEFSAHRLILTARSPVFASTFRHNMKESLSGIIEIDDCEPSPFYDFLFFLYCGDATKISKQNMFNLFTLGDKYEVLDLKAECLDLIKNNITVNTFCETITLALQHSETELITLATNFFVSNANQILPTVKWQIFTEENPTQSNELVIKFAKSVKQ